MRQVRLALAWFILTSILTSPAVVLAATAAPAAGTSARPTIEQAFAATAIGRSFSDVAIAPAGDRVAWVEPIEPVEPAGADPRRLDGRSAIWTAPLGAPRTARTRITAVGAAGANGGDERAPVFSPDGRTIAFLSNGGRGGQLDVWIAPIPPVEPPPPQRSRARPPAARKLTSFTGQLDDLRFLPDGSGLTLLAIEGRTAAAGPLAAVPRDAGVVGAELDVQRLARIDLATGRLSWLSPADLFVYEYDVAPSGEVVATGARGEGDAMWWRAEVWRIPAGGGAARSLARPRRQIAHPRWSPDGTAVAWIEGLMSDFGSTGGDVFAIPADGSSPPRNLTPGRAASPAWFAWTDPGHLLLLENVDGEEQIASLDVATGTTATLWRDAASLAQGGGPSLALARDGRTIAAIRSSFTEPPEVVAGPIGAFSAVTSAVTARNADVAPLWGAARSLHTESDGRTIQSWLLSPPNLPPGERAPLVVLVHGGPSSSHRPGWPGLAGILASQGYFVLLPNPRGSFGAGAEFQSANFQDLGGGDYRDIMRSVDAALALPPTEAAIDAGRLGIYGWSYGGYMAMWAVTQTDRFGAAIAGAGIANWQSYAGQNRIDEWLPPFFGATIDDDPWIYARSAPITFITRAKTPTLVLHGERDAEVPAPQGYEFWKALRRRGVPTELVIYPDQGHRLNPESDEDRARRIVGWLDRFLPPPAATLVVVDKSDAAIELVDPATGRATATLPVGRGPHEAAIAPDRKTAVVANYGPRGEPGSSLAVIDLDRRVVTATIDLGAPRRPHGLAFVDATTLAVTAEESGHLLLVDLATRSIRAEIATGQKLSHMVAVAPAAGGKRAFVANITSGTVTAIDLATASKLADVATGAGSEGIAHRPGSREIWVTNREADTLSVIDADALTVIATIPCPGFPIRIAFTPDGARALVSATRSGEVVAIDAAARREVARRRLALAARADAASRLFGDRFRDSPAPVGLLVAPNGRRAYVAATQADAVVEIDVSSLDVLRVLATGREPDGMAVR